MMLTFNVGRRNLKPKTRDPKPKAQSIKLKYAGVGNETYVSSILAFSRCFYLPLCHPLFSMSQLCLTVAAYGDQQECPSPSICGHVDSCECVRAACY